MEIILKQNRANPNEYYLAIEGSSDFLLKMELMGELKGEHEIAVKHLSTMSYTLKKDMTNENDTPDVTCTRYLNPKARLMTQGILNRLGMKWQTKPTPLDK